MSRLMSLLEGLKRELAELADLPDEALARKVGDQIGVDWNKVPISEFRIGLAVELEHGKADAQTNITDDDWMLTGKIALAHLKEFSDYYTKLAKIEPDIEKLRAQLSWRQRAA